MENKFEIAIRNKYRFPYKGMITIEDLWDLSVTQLDGIFKTLNALPCALGRILFIVGP